MTLRPWSCTISMITVLIAASLAHTGMPYRFARALIVATESGAASRKASRSR